LNKAIEPAARFIRPGMRGLDYGSGPARTLAALLDRMGVACDSYDPLFFPDADIARRYDFIFATECFEHFFFPSRELDRLLALMAKGASLIVMTSLWKSLDEFKNWSYARDFTHVSFYHAQTMDWIGGHYGLSKVFDDETRVVIFQST